MGIGGTKHDRLTVINVMGSYHRLLTELREEFPVDLVIEESHWGGEVGKWGILKTCMNVCRGPPREFEQSRVVYCCLAAEL